MADLEFDQQVAPGDSNTVVQAVAAYRSQAEWAKSERMVKNRENRDVFLSRQDFSYKMNGQSQEFLPKVAVAVEQMTAFIKRSLVQSGGEWFSTKIDSQLEPILYGHQITRLITAFMNNLWAPRGKTTFANVLSDGVKNGLLESLMIFKVHGAMVKNRMFSAESGGLTVLEDGSVEPKATELGVDEFDEWRLRIDLVKPEDYFPDPTGEGLYEIHSVERDLSEVLKMAEMGVYDMAAVRQLIDVDFKKPTDEERRPRDVNHQESIKPAFRKRVMLDEFWGTILNDDGTVAHENVVCTVANGRFLIRPPEPNPFWHQESPFVAQPIIRVPWSVWHKALYDDACRLNNAINEMFNLMLDGGLAAVWGVRQVRLDALEDPGQVQGGIPQGATLAVNSTLPPNAKAVETVAEGQVPQDAMAVFEFLNREFTQASLTNELKLGALPPKQVRATEVVEASQSQAITLEGIISDLELNTIEPLVYKAFMTILQNADSVPDDAMSEGSDFAAAYHIMRASPPERYELFVGHLKFQVDGISKTMAQAREFQKIMAILQAVTANPILFETFLREMSGSKTLRTMFRALNIDPDSVQLDGEELKMLRERIANMQALAPMMGGGAAGTQGGEEATTGEPGMPSEITQQANPMTGLTPNG